MRSWCPQSLYCLASGDDCGRVLFSPSGFLAVPIVDEEFLPYQVRFLFPECCSIHLEATQYQVAVLDLTLKVSRVHCARAVDVRQVFSIHVRKMEAAER